MASNRILIVEDDVDGQEVVTYIVQALNLQVDVAGDAEQAFHLLEHNGAYRAAIIDLALPGTNDGLELMTQMRGDGRFQNMPCVAITAYHTSKLRERAMQVGFNAYYAKPLDPSVMLTELRYLL